MGSLCGHQTEIPDSSNESHSSPSSRLEGFNNVYEVSERVLSRNSGCEVRLCKKKSSDALEVAKIVKGSLSSSCLEAHILEQLHHPHILKLVDFFKEDSQSCLVLEYLPNGDLSTLLTKISKVPEKTACQITHQVLSALAYCHEQGVVHRDIKPENILIDSIGPNGIYCQLADFDSAGLLEKSGKGVYGTLYYTAPEVFAGKYDEKVDVWSCGVMLYQLLTGRHLFVGSNSEEILDKISSEEIIFDNSISHEAQDLLEKMLNREACYRISSKEACSHSWFKQILNKKNIEVSQVFCFKESSEAMKEYEDYIVNNFVSRKEMKGLREVFKYLDTSFEGKIRVSDLVKQNDVIIQEEFWDFQQFLRAAVSEKLKSNPEVIQSFIRELKNTGKDERTFKEVTQSR